MAVIYPAPVLNLEHVVTRPVVEMRIPTGHRRKGDGKGKKNKFNRLKQHAMYSSMRNYKY